MRRSFIFVVLACLHLRSAGAGGSVLSEEDDMALERKLNKDKYGVGFDCVDTYKQPAFNHPLPKNHKLQANDHRSTGCLNLQCPGFIVLPAGTGGPSAAGGAAATGSWPELVGLSSEDAKKKIKEDAPGAKVQVVPAGTFVTMDYNTRRVRVFVDSNGKVARAPRIG